MKVLFTTNIASPYRVEFFNELSKYCDLTVTFERNNAKNRKKEWTNIKEVSFKKIFLNGINVGEESAFCPEIIKYIKNNKFDIIVIGGYSTPTGMYLIRYLKRKKIPFILNCDGGIKKENEKKIIYKLKKYFIGSAAYWLSTGKKTNEYLEYYGAQKEKIFKYNFTSINENQILNNPLNKHEKQRLKQKLNISSEFVVISVGSFIYRKGFDVLIKATPYINKNVEIIIVGDEPTEEYLELINKIEAKNIKFINFLSKEGLEEYYKIADVFVLPTREDIWGLVINEAMAKGIPIITTDKCVAGLELVQNEENGYIVPVDNEQVIANRINELLQNNELRINIQKNNIKKINDYTIEKMAKKHIEIFKKIKEIQ